MRGIVVAGCWVVVVGDSGLGFVFGWFSAKTWVEGVPFDFHSQMCNRCKELEGSKILARSGSLGMNSLLAYVEDFDFLMQSIRTWLFAMSDDLVPGRGESGNEVSNPVSSQAPYLGFKLEKIFFMFISCSLATVFFFFFFCKA